MKRSNFCELITPFESSAMTWQSEYPRPQLVRDSYLPLGTDWQLSVKSGSVTESLGAINMPFVPESRLSGIKRSLGKVEKWLYTCKFSLPDGFNVGRVILHFGAVDQIADVTLNGRKIGTHGGGYLPFSFDVTEYLLDSENTLSVEVRDELDTDIPYGKQKRKRGGMWYTPVSGIWQTVWLESVPENYISSLRITPTLDTVTIETCGGAQLKTITVETPDGMITKNYSGDSVTLNIENPRHWSPEKPYLYRFTLTDGSDTVRSYFALRTVTIEKVGGREYICLNGKPYFFHGLLDQGYYSDGIFLPSSPDGYLFDILKMKSLGFNMLRKHIKIEPELFYYYCDLHGMVVFQDMVNSGKYNFLIDTALPTIGLKRGIKHTASKRRREIFEKSCEETLNQLYNHPCVCYYTVFNEGWGQYDADRIYTELKRHDPTRVYDATSGWFFEKESDVSSEHVYFKKIDLGESKRPLVLSEFGGYSCRVVGHVYNLEKSYGYCTMADCNELDSSLRALYFDEVIPMISRGLCAAVLTQVSDIEDEINGLVTYDRQVVKVESDTMNEIKAAIDTAFANELDKKG